MENEEQIWWQIRIIISKLATHIIEIMEKRRRVWESDADPTYARPAISAQPIATLPPPPEPNHPDFAIKLLKYCQMTLTYAGYLAEEAGKLLNGEET